MLTAENIQTNDNNYNTMTIKDWVKWKSLPKFQFLPNLYEKNNKLILLFRL
ncbi:hypothetical protein FC19_GL000938 [Liquorilactobacillus aquaticus DSM 21051]|uniref:Uncharacterized protein n=1 Tax=Liquorilactobacillus aquaticus DSM 21051 TaxID=1423725 RepID=A0A0R2CYC3_9LACO|nr:hypothetical protein FC19_GL000938 [Liquorilactobacillus aquaticus DSM 21051]